MELQQRRSVALNIYNHGEERETAETKTEDVYQCLQYPPTAQRTDATKRPALGRKMMFLLIALIVLLLTLNLIISAVHFFHFRQTLGVMNRQSTSKEVWHLHDNVFYLFRNELGDCNTAKRFCANRNASLATVTQHNMEWLQSHTKGNHLIVRRSQSDGSGDSDSTFMDEDDSECDLLGVTPEQVEGWVCERAAQIS
ncbi:uncharacterized protein LOC118804118 [Colossoma macropomum]|uniref:uncharacterized protein LOC118804118 n=1 Tax=Colossoma macropomum TaxID=42526 RepID=UPI001863B6E7|nr:uncharacterized protein LOC118804118 [Colossoma macropomum]XP_036420638.1 uncharacterized protein LOC118804118 [Colossoma macropomum]